MTQARAGGLALASSRWAAQTRWPHCHRRGHGVQGQSGARRSVRGERDVLPVPASVPSSGGDRARFVAAPRAAARRDVALVSGLRVGDARASDARGPGHVRTTSPATAWSSPTSTPPPRWRAWLWRAARSRTLRTAPPPAARGGAGQNAGPWPERRRTRAQLRRPRADVFLTQLAASVPWT